MSKRLTKNQYLSTLPLIMSLAWPNMLEQLMQTAVQYIDIAMIGTLGTAATAAVGATTTINWLVGSSISALGIGFLALVSRACGAKENQRAREIVAQSVFVCLVIGTLFTVLTVGLSPIVPRLMQVDESIRELSGRYFMILYLPMLPRTAGIIFGTILRSAGDSKTPMKVGIYVNIINVLLNFLLIYDSRVIAGTNISIYGAGWGVEGAAAASAIAYAFGGIMISAALWKHREVSPAGLSIKPNWKLLKPCLKVALPNMLQRFGTSFGYVVFAAMINSLGDISTAAHTIANTVESAFYIPAYGMQTAAATLAGNSLGAGDIKKMHSFTRTIIFLEVAMMLVTGGLLFVFAPAMVAVFSKTAEVIILGSIVLRMVAVSEPFYGVSIIIEGILQGLGNTVVPFVFGIVGMWAIRIVGTFIRIKFFGLGLVSAWACMIFHNMLLFTAYVLYYKKGKWNPLEHKKV